MKKTHARSRQVVITVNYHFNTAGRRSGLRKDVMGSVLRAVTRRLERHGAIVIDGVEVEEV